MARWPHEAWNRPGASKAQEALPPAKAIRGVAEVVRRLVDGMIAAGVIDSVVIATVAIAAAEEERNREGGRKVSRETESA